MFRDEFKERYTTIPLAIFEVEFTRRYVGILSHQHKEMELITVLDGAGDFYVDGVPYHATAGEAVLVPPYALHRVAIENAASYCCVCFDLSLLWDKKTASGLEDGTLAVPPLFQEGQPYVTEMNSHILGAFRACKENGAGWEMEAIGHLSLLFAHLKKQGSISETEGVSKEPTFAAKAVRYIADRYAFPITSRTAAEAFYMNNSYFCRLFKKTFDCRFCDYLLTYRLEKAKIYVRDTHLPIGEIASKTGFRNGSYFGQAFKGRFGISPIAYRKGEEK